MSNSKKQPGFTAVEILVTLLIGSLLLFGGYQAYSLVVGNTAESRERSVASNYGYDALRRFEAQYVQSPCQARAEAAFPGGIISAPSNINIISQRFLIECPYGSSSGISKVTTKVTYGNPSKEIVHAIYSRD